MNTGFGMNKLLYSYYHHHHLTAIFQVNLDRIFFVHLLQYRNYGISSTGLQQAGCPSCHPANSTKAPNSPWKLTQWHYPFCHYTTIINKQQTLPVTL